MQTTTTKCLNPLCELGVVYYGADTDSAAQCPDCRKAGRHGITPAPANIDELEASDAFYAASGLRSIRSADKALRLAAKDGYTEADLLADTSVLRKYANRVRTGW